MAANVLENLGVNLKEIRSAVEKQTTAAARPLTVGSALRFTPRAKNALELAPEEAHGLARNYIGTEHLLLGLLR